MPECSKFFKNVKIEITNYHHRKYICENGTFKKRILLLLFVQILFIQNFRFYSNCTIHLHTILSLVFIFVSFEKHVILKFRKRNVCFRTKLHFLCKRSRFLFTTSMVAPNNTALVSKVIFSGKSILKVSLSIKNSVRAPIHCLDIHPTSVPEGSMI